MANQENLVLQGVPAVYSSSISLVTSGTDIKIVFEDSLPSMSPDGQTTPQKHVVALVSMSFHTAKDLSVLLGNAVANVEEQFGKVDTPFLRERQRRMNVSE